MTSTPNRTVSGDVAYAPFGEAYASSGSPELSFTGQNPDTNANLYDFMYREYGIQGRWPSPDPLGPGAFNLADPQSLNRYTYVLNNPESLIDPRGFLLLHVVGVYSYTIHEHPLFVWQWALVGFLEGIAAAVFLRWRGRVSHTRSGFTS